MFFHFLLGLRVCCTRKGAKSFPLLYSVCRLACLRYCWYLLCLTVVCKFSCFACVFVNLDRLRVCSFASERQTRKKSKPHLHDRKPVSNEPLHASTQHPTPWRGAHRIRCTDMAKTRPPSRAPDQSRPGTPRGAARNRIVTRQEARS